MNIVERRLPDNETLGKLKVQKKGIILNLPCPNTSSIIILLRPTSSCDMEAWDVVPGQQNAHYKAIGIPKEKAVIPFGKVFFQDEQLTFPLKYRKRLAKEFKKGKQVFLPVDCYFERDGVATGHNFCLTIHKKGLHGVCYVYEADLEDRSFRWHKTLLKQMHLATGTPLKSYLFEIRSTVKDCCSLLVSSMLCCFLGKRNFMPLKHVLRDRNDKIECRSVISGEEIQDLFNVIIQL